MVSHKEIISLIPQEVGELGEDMPMEEKESSYEIIKNYINEKTSSVQMPIDLLKTNGYIKLGNVLNAEETRRDIFQYPIYNGHVKVYSDHAPIHNYNKVSPPNGIYSWDTKDLMKCDSILNLISNPLLISFVSQYLGCPPTFYSCNCMLSVGDSGHGTNTKHRDRDDFKSVCVFVYLEDVSQDNGPHIYERGTHQEASTLKSSYPPSITRWIKKKLPSGEEQVVLEGKAGDGFITDPWGFHLGKPILKDRRICLWLRYGLYDNWASRHDEMWKCASSLSNIKMDTLVPLYNDYVFRFFSE